VKLEEALPSEQESVPYPALLVVEPKVFQNKKK
jgi:hypothetical protein